MKILIGIPIRNESETITDLLTSLQKNLKTCSESLPDFQYEIVICLNRTTDDSENKIGIFLEKENLILKIIKSNKAGKLNAIFSILKYLRENKINDKNSLYFFCDGDVTIDNNCLLNLVKSFDSKTEPLLNYAYSFPVLNEGLFLHRLKKAHYQNRENIFTENWYFKGGAYMFNDQIFDLFQNTESELEQLSLKLKISPPQTDDVLMSRIIKHRFKNKVINLIHNAKITYRTPESIFDMINEQIRIKYEFYKINLYYSELQYLNLRKNYKWKKASVKSKKINFKDAMLLKLYYLLDYLIKCYAKYIGVTFKRLFGGEQWKQTLTTKKKIN